MDSFRAAMVAVWNVLDLPGLLVLGMIVLFAYILRQIQSNPDNKFDFADIFRDESGKPSAARMMVIVSGGISSWAIMYMLIHSKDSTIDPVTFGSYVGLWSGMAVANKWLDNSRIPGTAMTSVSSTTTTSTAVKSIKPTQEEPIEEDVQGRSTAR